MEKNIENTHFFEDLSNKNNLNLNILNKLLDSSTLVGLNMFWSQILLKLIVFRHWSYKNKINSVKKSESSTIIFKNILFAGKMILNVHIPIIIWLTNPLLLGEMYIFFLKVILWYEIHYYNKILLLKPPLIQAHVLKSYFLARKNKISSVKII